MVGASIYVFDHMLLEVQTLILCRCSNPAQELVPVGEHDCGVPKRQPLHIHETLGVTAMEGLSVTTSKSEHAVDVADWIPIGPMKHRSLDTPHRRPAVGQLAPEKWC